MAHGGYAEDAAPSRRPRRSAAARRAQHLRALARAASLLVRGVAELHQHRGGTPSRLAAALGSAMEGLAGGGASGARGGWPRGASSGKTGEDELCEDNQIFEREEHLAEDHVEKEKPVSTSQEFVKGEAFDPISISSDEEEGVGHGLQQRKLGVQVVDHSDVVPKRAFRWALQRDDDGLHARLHAGADAAPAKGSSQAGDGSSSQEVPSVPAGSLGIKSLRHVQSQGKRSAVLHEHEGSSDEGVTVLDVPGLLARDSESLDKVFSVLGTVSRRLWSTYQATEDTLEHRDARRALQRQARLVVETLVGAELAHLPPAKPIEERCWRIFDSD